MLHEIFFSFLDIYPKLIIFFDQVISPFPPSDKVGIKSIQRVDEEILPMKAMKMGWVPYIPLDHRHNQVDRLKSEIFTLACTQRSDQRKMSSNTILMTNKTLSYGGRLQPARWILYGNFTQV
ncbi:hypothetical protein ZOSMA_42G01360 [Zostera marina]|uniref:Uncharacterized protein n=1 Tax=Zostera marina TaxID=29655 RepID=A0A0K9P4H8_ZOSMR|nr:hypothetical protein ZOSMA_42G01360 [Zostera marina]